MASGGKPKKQPSAQSDPELPFHAEELLASLPEELRALAKNLLLAVPAKGQIEPCFASFCSAAYVKPEWAGPASEFLAEVFADQEDILAELARIPDLIIELATGHITLTCIVASRWAARGETPRLARLAEALIATQSKMSGEGVVEVMLALATSLAITRYSRAEQLLAAAEPHATQDQREALLDARLWLSAGSIVRGFTPEARDLWDQRLRRSKENWSWDSREERDALLQLAGHISDDQAGASLFRAVVPRCWWDLATLKTARDSDPPPPPPRPAAPTTGVLPRPPYATVLPRDPAPDPRRAIIPFLSGVALGAVSAAVIYIVALQIGNRASRVNQPPELLAQEVAPHPDGIPTPTPAPSSPTTPSPTPAPPPTAPAPAPDDAESNAAAASPAPSQPPAESDNWRRGEARALATDHPELLSAFASAKTGTWAENENLLMGESYLVPRSSPLYLKLLRWLHLDPPEDEQTRRQVPVLLAALQPDQALLDLWKRLAYEGSPIGAEVRTAAQQQIHHNSERQTWTPSQLRQLTQIAGWGMAKAE